MAGNLKKLNSKEVLDFYSRNDVKKIIFEEAKDKEIGIIIDYGKDGEPNYGFGKRPDVITSPADVLELVKQGATSFHFSEEIWNDPLGISSDLSKRELDGLRKGWDLILDIDTSVFKYSQIAADLIVEYLQFQNIKSLTCKFSGNHGFHIAIPFEAFPERVYNKEVKLLFPEGPRVIAEYLKEQIKEFLKERLLETNSEEEIANNLKLNVEEIKKNGEFDPFKVVDIDTILISSRHLCRMPYSFNEKSGLVSIPINVEEIKNFDRNYARPANIGNVIPFINRDVVKGEALNLFVAAFDYYKLKTSSIHNIDNEEIKKKIDYEELSEAIPEEFFPPCIKKILKGMHDGKKRELFILINFLRSSGWGLNAIEQRVQDWNKLNKEPLKEVYIKGQLNHARNSEKKLPPNCSNEDYYKGIDICLKDTLCEKVKNPLAYSKRRYFMVKYNNKKSVNKKS